VDGTKHPLTDVEQRLVHVAEDHGFRLTHQVKYYCELEHAERPVTLYLDRQRTPRNVIAVMVDPDMDTTPLHTVQGLTIASDLRHGSNMRCFPKRLHTGSKPIPYARPVECADITAFGQLLRALG
jgi:hypothetical protein